MSFEGLEPKIWFHLSIHTLASVHPSSGCAAQLYNLFSEVTISSMGIKFITRNWPFQSEHPQREVMKRVLVQEPKMPLISCAPEGCRAWQHTGEVRCKSVKEIKGIRTSTVPMKLEYEGSFFWSTPITLKTFES